MHKTKERIKEEKNKKRPISKIGPPTIKRKLPDSLWTKVVTNPGEYCRGLLF